MSVDYLSQIISILGPAIGPLGGVIVGGVITYKVQLGLAKQNDIKAIYSKLFGLKKLIKQLYISRSHAETLRLYHINLPHFSHNPIDEKEYDKISLKIDRLDVEIAQTEAQIAETCGKALIHTKNEKDKTKILQLLNHPNLTNIEEAFTTVGKGVKDKAGFEEWIKERRTEGVRNVEEKINSCFLPVESIKIFKF